MLKRNSTAGQIEAAKEALEQVNGQIKDKRTRRDAALLAEDNFAEVERIDRELAGLERQARLWHDKLEALQAQGQREEVAARAKRKADLIGRIESKLAERDKVGAELGKTLAAADALFRRLIALSGEASVAWPWETSHIHATALSPTALRTLVSHEIFRTGGRAFLGGRPGAQAELDFPGAVAPTLQLRGQPERIPALADVLREASRYAGSIMRGEAHV
jgi:hypothetical protein